MLKQLIAGLLAGASMSAAMAAGPDGYPARPVTVIVPFAPGGGSDNVARIIATRLSERTGGTFIIDNKPGAGTNIGNEQAARAKTMAKLCCLAKSPCPSTLRCTRPCATT